MPDPAPPTTDIATVPIDDLIRHPDTPRRGDIPAISASIEVNGWYGAVVAQSSTRHVLAGNNRMEAARRLGMTDLPVHWLDVDDATARRIMLADNRTNDLATYDDAVLVQLLEAAAADDGLFGTGYDGDDLDDLLADIASDVDDDPGAGAVPDDPITRRGDLIILGEHRLVCGDSFDLAVLDEAVAGLPVGCVLTDPPYGVCLQTDYSIIGGLNPPSGPKSPGVKYRSVVGDDHPFDAAPFVARFDDVREQFWWGADYYRATIPEGDLAGSWLVWDKRVDESLDAVLGAAFELCWSRQKHQRRILRHVWTNYNSHDNDGHARAHPTEKPVLMLRDILDRWAPDKCRVVDPFAGSGTTLIAAHNTGRTCSAVEIDPGYCDVIVTRWEEATGQTAMRP